MFICTYTCTLWCILIREQAEHFQLAQPEFALVQELEEEISQYEQTWSLYEDYSNTLQTLANEDWITFRYIYLHVYIHTACACMDVSLFILYVFSTRGKTYLFEDFLTSWGEKLRNSPPSVLTVKLQQEIEKYQVKKKILNNYVIYVHIWCTCRFLKFEYVHVEVHILLL